MTRLAGRLLRAPFSRTGVRTLACCAAGGLLAVASMNVVIGCLLIPGAALSVTIAGTVPGLLLVAAAPAAARAAGTAQRRLLGRLAGARLSAPPRFEPGSGFLGRLDARLRDRAGWRAVAYTVARTPVAALQLYACFVYGDGLVNLTYPLIWALFRNHPAGTRLGPLIGLAPVPFGRFAIGTWPGTFLAAGIGAVCVLAAPPLARAAVAGDIRLARALLGPDALTQRVRQLEDSRALAVDDAAAALRQVERDLHDGAQVRLAALALNLGMAREKAGGADPDLSEIRELLDAAAGSAAGALADLRDLARGIHPPVLDSGLEPALASLAASSAIPARVSGALAARPAPAIETMAYFCAAELVANANKHSFANRIEIIIDGERGRVLRLTVRDDGVGGADLATSGLRQRISTVDGRLDVSSPPGGPTAVTIELPVRA
jgi:signal transduction histidine kinase